MVETVLAFVRRQFTASIGNRPIDAHTPLFSTGIVDSFGVLELIAFLEDTFGVDIDPARHELSEFDTAAKIASLVQRLEQDR